MTDNSTKPAFNWRGMIQELPRLHLALFGLAAAMVFLALLLPSGQVQANRRPMPLPADIATEPQLTLPELTAPALPDATPAEPERDAWQEMTVRKGDNLAKIFERAGVSPSEMHEVLQSGPEAKALTRIYPGQKLSFQIDDNGQLMALRYQENQLNSTEYYRDDSNFVAEKTSREPEVRHQFASGTITSSLYKAGQDAGLTDSMILQFANIFSGVVDFVLDLRANDHFTVMYDEYYLDGKKNRRRPDPGRRIHQPGRDQHRLPLRLRRRRCGLFLAGRHQHAQDLHARTAGLYPHQLAVQHEPDPPIV
jgi:hypothetical protein